LEICPPITNGGGDNIEVGRKERSLQVGKSQIMVKELRIKRVNSPVEKTNEEKRKGCKGARL